MNVSVFGFYSFSNFGDSLMLDRIILQLNNCNVSVFSDSYKKYDNIEIFDYEFNDSYLNSDVIIFGGGNIINPKFWGFKKEILEKIKEKGIPIIFYNVGVTKEIEYDINKGFPKLLKDLNAKWVVRDTASKERLEKHGINSVYVPDVSFGLELEEVPRDNKKLTIFLNSYLFHDLLVGETYKFLHNYKSLIEISYFLNWMIHFGWQINLVSAQTSKFNDDRVNSALMYGLIKNKNKAECNYKSLTWQEVINEIKSSGLVISTRYHVTTSCIANNIPFIDITFHAKNKSILNDSNLTELSVDYNKFTIDDFIAAANKTKEIAVLNKIQESKLDNFNRVKNFSLLEFIKNG